MFIIYSLENSDQQNHATSIATLSFRHAYSVHVRPMQRRLSHVAWIGDSVIEIDQDCMSAAGFYGAELTVLYTTTGICELALHILRPIVGTRCDCL